MPSRRSHAKTRNGCVLCKKRKVKCDGVLPGCRNCARYGSPCSFLESQSASFSSHDFSTQGHAAATISHADQKNVFIDPASCSETSSGSTAAPNRQSCEFGVDPLETLGSPSASPSQSPARSSIDVDPRVRPVIRLHTTPYDEELLNHYMTSTYLSISNKTSVQEAYRTTIPEEALSHEHLMHAVLGFTAAHLMHTRLDRRDLYERKARRHQHLSLSTSIADMANLNPSNCHALFATAGIIAILAFALQSPLAEVYSCPLDDITDFFILVRGIKTILRSAQFDRIMEGKLRVLVDYDWHPPISHLQGNIKGAFDRLIKLNTMTVKSPDLQETYIAVIDRLKRAFETYIVIQYEKTLALGVWTTNLPDLYLSLLRRREPMALVILAHYGVLLHSINGIWWSEGRGARLVEAINESLPTAWLPELQWPNAVVHGACNLILKR